MLPSAGTCLRSVAVQNAANGTLLVSAEAPDHATVGQRFLACLLGLLQGRCRCFGQSVRTPQSTVRKLLVGAKVVLGTLHFYQPAPVILRPHSGMWQWLLAKAEFIFQDGKKIGHAVLEPLGCELLDGGSMVQGFFLCIIHQRVKRAEINT